MTREPYADRREAGWVLADELREYAGRDDVVVLGLPRGGVPVAAIVARALGAPLDVVVVRKLGVPGQPELAMGAITGVGDSLVVVRNETVLAHTRVGEEAFRRVLDAETAELRRREKLYRGDRPRLPVRGKIALVVDDGLATGSSVRAAIAALRREEPARLVVAVPVGSASSCAVVAREADEVVCAWAPEPFYGVGQGYYDFSQTSDAEVRDALAAGRAVDDGGAGQSADGDGARRPADGEGARRPGDGGAREEAVRIPVGAAELDADLVVPAHARSVVIFAHGSGSGRHSPRNRYVAEALRRAGHATLLMDLLTQDEEQVDLRTRELRFDIGLLATRLAAAVDWWTARHGTDLPVVTFGASTGAAAALIAAAERPAVVGVVSRGGRPDLAGGALGRVRVPVLLVVGGEDRQVLELNRQAAAALGGPVEIAVVPGATHLFEEPGTLDEVIRLTVAALDRWLAGRPA
ncbi:phosphoribosyltransferase [Georgenia sp. EYE_87]|uniref:phosphoribosyltransferase n=1 Tax=Georgenia sp. EYE_87 TaxID=2853448 RepID=UPI002003F7B1|nr:phosphoribosyltransferase [Georgenia sp. EYE_87]